MSFMGSIGSFFSGGADKDAERAAQQQAAGYTAAGVAIDAGEGKALSLYAPYVEAGGAATNQQSRLLGLKGPGEADAAFADFRTTPGYQFSLDQGARTVEGSAAARGGLYSGTTGKALTRFGQGVADQEFGNYYSRLASLGATGYGASSASAGTVTAAAGQRADSLIGKSNAIAGGTINASNARSQGISNALALVGKLAGAAAGGATGVPA